MIPKRRQRKRSRTMTPAMVEELKALSAPHIGQNDLAERLGVAPCTISKYQIKLRLPRPPRGGYRERGAG